MAEMIAAKKETTPGFFTFFCFFGPKMVFNFVCSFVDYQFILVRRKACLAVVLHFFAEGVEYVCKDVKI